MSVEQLLYRHERWMYRSGRPNRLAAALNRIWASLASLGVRRHWLVTLEVEGRTSGRTLLCPLIVASHDGREYLVSMLGERAQWVRNVRATRGRAVLRRGGRERVVLVEVDPAERAPILRRYLDVAPAARSFVPVDRKAPIGELAAIAADYPVFRIDADPERPQPVTPPAAAARPVRRRRWRRWLAIGGVALAVVVGLSLLGLAAYLESAGDPPFALPQHVAPPQGDVAGTWSVAPGSRAGFRIEQTVLGMSGDVTGRTGSVAGTVTVAGSDVSAASFSVDLTTVTSGGKRSPQLDKTLETSAFPHATVTLTAPVAITPAFVAGDRFTATVAGQFTLHGVTRPVAASIAATRDGSAIEVVGSIPVVFSEWGVATPAGYGALGSVADHGLAEFLLVLHRAAP